MRPKSLMLIMIALGCGLVASIGISQVVDRGGDAKEVQTTPIYVAMADLAIGQKLGPKSIKIEEWPVDKVPEGAVRDLADLEGMRPKQPMYSGEPILVAKLANRDDLLGNARRIKKGYRVAAVKVTRESAVAGLIFPGDHVDVMSFVRGSSREEPRAKTVLTNIEVFAINDRIDRVLDGEGNSIDAKTVSLLVKPQEGEQLMYFANLGPLNLALRRPDDDTDLEPEPIPEPIQPIVVQPEPVVPAFEEPLEDRFVMEIYEGGQTSARRFKINEDGNVEEIGVTSATQSNTGTSDDDGAELPFPSGDQPFDDDLPPPRGPVNNEPGGDVAQKIDWSFLSE